MGTFSYIAADERTGIVRGSHEAPDERAVITWLRERGYYPIRVGSGDNHEAVPALHRLSLLARWPSRQDVLVFTQQFFALLDAGLEVDRSLAILAELAENNQMRRVIRQILTDVQGGSTLADSMARHPRLFSRLYVNMVRAGEAGGVLEVVLGRLGAFLENAKTIRDEVVSALVYPLLVLAVGGGAVMLLLTFVLPRFARIFTESGQLLPLSTRALLAISNFAAGYWWLLGSVLVFAGLGIRGYVQTEGGKAVWDRVKLRLPLLGRIIRELEAARFTRTLGTLLQSGVPVLTALGIVTETVGNSVIAEALPRLKEAVKRGEGIAGPFRMAGVFPPMAVHMARVGEETGRLENMLLKVADVYDGRVKTSVKRLLSLLEPFLILLLGLVVGFIVLSMLLAILSISDLPI